jgi:hypothetical protein
MSLTFTQLTEKLDKSCGTNSTTYPLTQKEVDINIALDDSLAIIFQQGGTHQFDDKNHTADPIITTDLVDGQRDYHFTTDEQANVILDILEVWTKNSSTGDFKRLERVDMVRNGPDTMHDGDNTEGVPTKYGLLGNGIFLDYIPSYDSTGGLKIIINRQASYFVSTDTTKTAGIDGLCHDFLYLKPAYEYARDKGLHNVERLFRDLQIATEKLKGRYKIKERQVINKLTPKMENCR